MLAAGTSKALQGLEAAQEAANATLGSLQAALALLQESAEAVVTVERARGLPDDPVSRLAVPACVDVALDNDPGADGVKSEQQQGQGLLLLLQLTMLSLRLRPLSL